MSDGDLDIKFYGDAAHVIKEQAKLIKQQEQAFEAYKKLATESKKAGKEAEKAAKEVEKAQAAAAKELERFVRATKDINRTPLEKYADEMLKLDRALKSGKLDQESFNRAVIQAKSAYQAATTARVQAFGGGALSSLSSYVAGFGGLVSAATLFRGAMQQVTSEMQASKTAFEELINQRRELLQISDGQFDAVTGQADEIAVKHGIPRREAYSLLTSAKNEGFTGEVDYIARAISANLVSQEAASTVAGQVPGLFPKTPVTPQQALNITLAAAGSSRLSFEGISAGMPIAGEGMSQLGSNVPETAAVLSVLSSRFRSGETAGQRVSLLAGKMANDPEGRFSGKGLMAGVSQLTAMAPEQRREFLKDDAETNAAYSVIVEERTKILDRLKSAERAKAMSDSDESIVATAERTAFDPTTRQGRIQSAFVERQRSLNVQQIQQEGEADYAYSVETAANNARTRIRASGNSGPVTRLISGAWISGMEGLGMSPELIDKVGSAGAHSPLGYAESGIIKAVSALVGSSGDLERAANNLERASSQTNYTNGARANQATAGGAVEAR